MYNWMKYAPHAHIIIWAIVAIIAIWKLRPLMDVFISAVSEKKPDGSRGEVSIKRIIPLIFSLLICYMVVGYMHNGKQFNDTAFWGLLLFIGLATTVITVTQASGLLDKMSILKSKTIIEEGKKTVVEQQKVESSTAASAS